MRSRWLNSQFQAFYLNFGSVDLLHEIHQTDDRQQTQVNLSEHTLVEGIHLLFTEVTEQREPSLNLPRRDIGSFDGAIVNRLHALGVLKLLIDQVDRLTFLRHGGLLSEGRSGDLEGRVLGSETRSVLR